MPRGRQFRRRIRVSVSDTIVTDIDPNESFETNEQRTLDVVFETQGHVKAAPLMTTLQVWGLNKREREKLTNAQNAAANIAWKSFQAVQSGTVLVEDEQILQAQQQLAFKGGIITIEAGYQDDFALIAKAQMLPRIGVTHKFMNPGWLTTVRAQDTRYPWQNSFVSEEVAPGVTMVDLQAALQIAEQFQTGEANESVVRATVPGLLETKDFGGYANGRVLHGDSRNFEKEILDRLGYRRFFDRGEVRLIRADETTEDDAVVLRLPPKRATEGRNPGGLLEYELQTGGFALATTLLNHRCTTGRQVLLQESDGSPIGGGTFRIDEVRHVGSNFETSYNSELILRPVTVDLTKNI